MPNPIKSAAVIARLLITEGFSDHLGNQIEKYWMRNICHGASKRRYRKFDKEISEMLKKLTDAERLVLGKWISYHKAMSFDTGLRIGLTAFAKKNDKEIQV